MCVVSKDTVRTAVFKSLTPSLKTEDIVWLFFVLFMLYFSLYYDLTAILFLINCLLSLLTSSFWVITKDFFFLVADFICGASERRQNLLLGILSFI